MKSPFPGMDPYLETRWGDVHSRLNIYASDTLRPALSAEDAKWAEQLMLNDPN